MPAALVPIAGAVAGSVVSGAMNKGGGGSSQTTTNEPWSAVQPWMKENIEKGQKLQGYYEQNPFNQLQQTSYQNLYGDIDNYRQNMAPSMMALSNRLMNSNYQRAPAGSEMGGFLKPERSMGAGTYTYGAAPAPGGMGQDGTLQGLLGQAGQGQTPLMQGGGLLGGGGYSGALGGGLMAGQGQDLPQAMGQSQGLQSSGLRPTDMIPTMRTNPGEPYGQIDFKALNPWTSGSIKEETPTQSNNDLTDLEREYLRTQFMNDKQRYDQYGSDAFSGAFIPNFGGGTSTVPMTPFIRKMIGN